MPASAITSPEPAIVTEEASTWRAVGVLGAQREQPIFLGAHRASPVRAMRLHGVGRGAVAQHRDAAGDVVAS